VTDRWTEPDVAFMERALTLACRGQGRVEPNPMVGCVLVRRGRIVAEGYHRRYGGPHAEIDALRRAGGNTRGATAYVTLEPCCHQGKTGPCADALIEAGIARVVVAMKDPFPQVAGGGLIRLRRAGLQVAGGLCRGQAIELNTPYLTLIRRRRPYVILKWAQSIDGRIATRTGDSQWISGPQSRRLVHRLRARVDGVLVGIGTALVDDPSLTARDVPVRRQATRIVLDTHLRLPPRSKLVATATHVPVLVLTSRAALRKRSGRADALRRKGVELETCRLSGGVLDPADALQRLGRRRLTNLLVEGGGRVLGSLLDRRLADEAYVFVAPKLIGGAAAVSAYPGLGTAKVAEGPGIASVKTARSGDDLLYRIRFDQ
ncbi:MAG: bifunctional diaminohydroxyphosphoribosylaminopyrimidine deaminase/5-amino-6-(5-phosphoribosylamino)uracil reductase RibD, partial [bacterium]|nr:bifunctional diaminohydroxyphosphoribosylaminopyrimidine deaminase/5-amino-6-(5-phosphoribosylamino)uracil reductase RibD [bacterium]